MGGEDLVGSRGGKGREISSCQQIVNSPTEKKNRTKKKKNLKESKEKNNPNNQF